MPCQKAGFYSQSLRRISCVGRDEECGRVICLYIVVRVDEQALIFERGQ